MSPPVDGALACAASCQELLPRPGGGLLTSSSGVEAGWRAYAERRFPILSKLFPDLVLYREYARLLNKTFRGPDQAAFAQLLLPPRCAEVFEKPAADHASALLARLTTALGAERLWSARVVETPYCAGRVLRTRLLPLLCCNKVKVC